MSMDSSDTQAIHSPLAKALQVVERTGRSRLPDLGIMRHIARRLAARLSIGKLTVITPSGEQWVISSGNPLPEATLVIRRWRTIRRLLLDGDIGFAEAYLAGDWTSPDVSALIELGARNDDGLGPAVDAILPLRLLNRLRHRLRANSKSGSRRNIPEHYDLGNEFYALWLDPEMSYSSGIYCEPGQSLETAQLAKQDRAIELLDLRAHHRVLEIGCGWGGLARRMIATKSASVTAITLSKAQLAHAKGLLQGEARADIRLQDYREVPGKFDRIVSIEMLEAVGEAYWPTYFRAIRDRLAPGGYAVLQGITIEEKRFDSYRGGVDFIQRYIFPGGMLPTVTEMRRQVEAAGLRLVSLETFGDSYAKTLAEWNRRFQAAWPQIEHMGFPPRFRRMWEYYLAYCEGGFSAGAINVGLYKLEHA